MDSFKFLETYSNISRMEKMSDLEPLYAGASLTFEQRVSHRHWPEFAYGSFYLDLIEMAQEQSKSNEPSKQLASILINQQLVEEWLIVADYWCHFEIQMGIYPTNHPYQAPERRTFGQIILSFKNRQNFKGKDALLQAATAINGQSRNKVAHQLLQGDNLKNLPSLAKIAQHACEDAAKAVNEALEYFLERFDSLAPNTGIPDQRPKT